MKKEVDFIIIGQGLAGSLLAWNLIQAKRSVIILDTMEKQSASRVAAGIINPFAGKRLAFSWEFERHWAAAEKVYSALELQFQQKFLTRRPILRFYENVKTQNDWLARIDKSPSWFQEYLTALPALKKGLGSILCNGGAQLDVQSLLEHFKNYFSDLNVLQRFQLDFKDLVLDKNKVVIGKFKAEKIIFCEGYRVIDNPFFNSLPFQPTHGDLLLLEIPNLPEEYIYIKGIFLAPAGKKRFLAGSTYYFDNLSPEPLEQGKQELLRRIKSWLNTPFTLLEHRAGVRSGTQLRRPVIGIHPQQSLLGIFNGLGSKGALLGPYWADHATAVFSEGKRPDPEVDIHQFHELLI